MSATWELIRPGVEANQRSVDYQHKEEHMLHFITDAPSFVVREIFAFARGWVEDAGWDDPHWAQAIIHVNDEDAPAVLHALRSHRVQGLRAAKVAIGDPTFVLAAAIVDRGSDGSPSAAAHA